MLANKLHSCPTLIQWQCKTQLHDIEKAIISETNNLVNKDPINNHYATWLILLSRDVQEGKKTDALTADKDLISVLLFEGKDRIRDSHAFSAPL